MSMRGSAKQQQPSKQLNYQSYQSSVALRQPTSEGRLFELLCQLWSSAHQPVRSSGSRTIHNTSGDKMEVCGQTACKGTPEYKAVGVITMKFMYFNFV